MKKYVLLVKALLKLGIGNLVRVLFYRVKVKVGWFKRTLPGKRYYFKKNEDFFPLPELSLFPKGNFKHWADQLTKNYPYFFNDNQKIQNPPSWFLNPYTQDSWEKYANEHWSQVRYFPQPGNDIKTIWELSRFYWAPWFAMAYGTMQNNSYLYQLNHWVKDWCFHNPVNQGVNWLCAQEVSIRALNILLVHFLLNIQPSNLMREFLISHALRIEKTMHYAYAQQNNHATSEAAALYLIGIFLEDIQADKWKKLGRKYLEVLSEKLILSDGTFSQYSMTYHRLALDTFSLVVFAQRKYKAKIFSKKFISKYQKLFIWLLNLVDTETGDAPNLGANDGTLLFKLDSCDYRNFKPSLQLASVLLNKERLFPEGPWDDPLKLLQLEYITLPLKPHKQSTKELVDGGYVCFKNDKSFALLNYANFKFRPSQADVFHFDLWVKGENVLLDSGSYSYNSDDEVLSKLSTVKGHNTVQFDRHDQMPKLSRFLYGSWVKTKVFQPLLVDNDGVVWCGEYKDYKSCLHRRKVTQQKSQYIIEDYISGYCEQAVLRWHAKNIEWLESDNGWVSQSVEMVTKINDAVAKLEKRQGKASFYYHTAEDIVVFELSVLPPECTITTIIRII